VGRLAQGLARPRDEGLSPGWLRPEQQVACSQLLPILDRYHCALLADPVGSGKTYVALAVASRWKKRGPVVVLAPAAILSQWERAAARTEVPLILWSHERVSRGSVPPCLPAKPASPSLVIIDESHHFRNPGAHRYRHVAPHLRGRTVLLLSATPVVNNLGDLAAQLVLGARDDALLPFGLPSIREHLASAREDCFALGELILTSPVSFAGKPVHVRRKARGLFSDTELEERCRRIESLALSTSRATAALIRTVVWRAMASSDMALLGVLRRYRSLLLQARDASISGKALTRSALKTFAGDVADQLIMWDLFPQPATEGDLVPADLDPLETLISELKAGCKVPDQKCRRLAALVDEGTPTLVFTGSRDTVRYLREQLHRAAWCTGADAGIGITRMDREDVLSWFRPGAPAAGGPAVLITTDVSAEGLDLQHAARVIHYDLPWTAVRIDQRNGRALRLGSRHPRVEVIRFELPGPIEQRLGQLGAIARKRRLPGKAGIDPHGARAWLWRDNLAARFAGGDGSGRPQYCRVQSPYRGVLAGFSLYEDEAGSRRRLSTVVGCITPEGSWTEEPRLIARMMEFARVADLSLPLNDQNSLAGVAEVMRRRLELLQLARWTSHLSPLQARLITRLNRLAARAVQARKGALVSSVEQGINFVRRGHTAGEELWLERLLTLSDSLLIEELRQCPEEGRTTPSSYGELLGVVIFTPGAY
jgi:superfamily II DNA or RNA helicase